MSTKEEKSITLNQEIDRDLLGQGLEIDLDLNSKSPYSEESDKELKLMINQEKK